MSLPCHVNDNVYIITLVIWNDGDLEIKKEDVREKLKLELINGGNILDYSITKQTHPNISQFNIIPNNGMLFIDWEYFDPKFGFELQVIYSGTDESEIILTGYILNSKIKKIIPRNKFFITDVMYIIIFIFSLFYLLVTYASKKIDGDFKPDKSQIIFRILFLLTSSIAIYVNFICGYELPL